MGMEAVCASAVSSSIDNDADATPIDEHSHMNLQSDLIRVVQELSVCREVDAVMGVLRAAARDLTGADGVTIVLRENDLCHYADENAIAPLWKGKRFPMSSCISGWCMMHQQQVVVPDIYDDDRIPHDAYRPTFVASLAMTPIRTADPIGAIGAYWATPHVATTEELAILQALGDSASTAFANVQLFESLTSVNRRKDEFLVMLAHELRNPLVPIRNAAHVLWTQAGNGDVANRAHAVMERQMNHVSRIVEDLLDVSRIARGTVTLRRERVDLSALASNIVADQRTALQAAGISLETTLPSTPVWADADSTRVTQVLTNVLDNARKFTPAGGRVTLQLTVDGDEVTAIVRDTGVGIEPTAIAHVFEAFAQADRSLDRAVGGLGLGLAVAKAMVDLHGGSIQAMSDGAGTGTEITIRLPVEPHLVGDAPAPASANVDRPRVLIVEDNPDAAETMRMILEVSGFPVTVAMTGPDGVTAAQRERPGIVVCDIGLPGMDGYTVARMLRCDPTTAEARLIAITGYGSSDDRARAMEAGFDIHLVKPVAPSRLLELLVA